MIIPSKLSQIPVLIMVDSAILLLPNTMVLGGVATGSIKAHDAEIVTGIISNKGWHSAFKASSTINGRIK